MWQLTKRSAPLAYSAGIYTLNPNIVIFFARPALGKALFAIFFRLQQLTTPGSMVMNAFGLAITPRLARYYAEGRRRRFRVLLLQSIAGTVAMGALGIAIVLAVGKWLLPFLFRLPEYADYVDILVWLLVAATISYAVGLLGYASTATRTFNRFAIPYTGITLVALAASALFIPRWGMAGAALSYMAIHLAAAAAFLWILALAKSQPAAGGEELMQSESANA
jgi:O-antigen/teichoic acid export membrane protein